MNKYEEKMNELIKDFGGGIWFKNDSLKIGYSYAEVEIEDGDYIDISSEEDYILAPDCYDSWEEVFKTNEDVKFVITKDCADYGNFVTWQEFKDAIDGKGDIHIVAL